jgi:hypothetical protein
VASNIHSIDTSGAEKNKIIWIGRLCRDKIYSLLYVLRMLEVMGPNKFEVHIVGDGSYKDLIEPSLYDNVNVVHHGFVKNDALSELILSNNIGLAVGMGTSILETSAMGLPSLLIDPSYKEISKDYSPKWTYEIKDFVLGDFRNKTKGRVFSEYYSELLADEERRVAKKCYNYVLERHSLSEVARKLEAYFV